MPLVDFNLPSYIAHRAASRMSYSSVFTSFRWGNGFLVSRIKMDIYILVFVSSSKRLLLQSWVLPNWFATKYFAEHLVCFSMKLSFNSIWNNLVSVAFVPVQVMLQWHGEPSNSRSKSSGIVFSSIHPHSVHFLYRMSTLRLCFFSKPLLPCL